MAIITNPSTVYYNKLGYTIYICQTPAFLNQKFLYWMKLSRFQMKQHRYWSNTYLSYVLLHTCLWSNMIYVYLIYLITRIYLIKQIFEFQSMFVFKPEFGKCFKQVQIINLYNKVKCFKHTKFISKCSIFYKMIWYIYMTYLCMISLNSEL